MAKKGAAQVIEDKDVSPAWKVLQMRLNEERVDKEREASEKKMETADGEEGFTVVKKKQQKSRKRKLQDALAEVKTGETPSEKRAKEEDIPILTMGQQRGEPTPVVALDCEYVGGGPAGDDDILARVSVVNQEGAVIYDKYVKPRERVTDFRTAVSGIRPGNLVKGLPFQTVQFETAKLLKDRIVVGHAVHNDFRVLNFNHNRKLTRDTAKCSILKGMAACTGKTPSLKKLASAVLGIDIQQGEHDSVTDARVALRLYLTVKKRWEAEIKRFHRHK